MYSTCILRVACTTTCYTGITGSVITLHMVSSQVGIVMWAFSWPGWDKYFVQMKQW